MSALAALALIGCAEFDRSGQPAPDTGVELPDAFECVTWCVGGVAQECPGPVARTCSLGCTSDGTRCLDIVPSQGLTQAFDDGTEPLVIASGTQVSLDTDTGEMRADGRLVRAPILGVDGGVGFYDIGGNISVLAVASLTVQSGAVLRARGDRALLVFSTRAMTIRGTIDVSAGCEDGTRTCGGPGGGDGAPHLSRGAAGCRPGYNGSTSGQTGGGGGGGASSSGGRGGTSSSTGVPGGSDGSRCTTALDLLQGGSGGGAGAITRNIDYGKGGGGGGAIQLTSMTQIIVGSDQPDEFAHILANGKGGKSGSGFGGGGGGGAGGTIVLEAPLVTLARARLSANGGGGGAGNSSSAGQDGQPGSNPASGGSGGAPGGRGAARLGLATSGSGSTTETGGGGGGGGNILLRTQASGLVISEEADISPGFSQVEPDLEPQ